MKRGQGEAERLALCVAAAGPAPAPHDAIIARLARTPAAALAAQAARLAHLAPWMRPPQPHACVALIVFRVMRDGSGAIAAALPTHLITAQVTQAS